MFFDRSKSELKSSFFFIKGLNGFIPNVNSSKTLDPSTAAKEVRLLQAPPPRFDWRNYGVVTNVKNQGSCSACWAFAATDFLEGEGIRRGKLFKETPLSVQYLKWCTASGTWKCKGGDPMRAVTYGLSRGMPF